MVLEIITLLMAKQLDELGIFDLMTEAKFTEDKELAVYAAKASEKIALAVAFEVTKRDEVLLKEHGEKSVQEKREFEKALIEHNYGFLDLPTPFEEGETLDEVKGRNGFATDGSPFTDEAIALVEDLQFDL